LLGGNGQRFVLAHGTTAHGAAWIDPAHRDEPLLYYHHDAPLGELFRLPAARRQPPSRRRRAGDRGTIMLRAPEDRLDVFEIDPIVKRLALDQRFFHFMTDCGATAKVVLVTAG